MIRLYSTEFTRPERIRQKLMSFGTSEGVYYLSPFRDALEILAKEHTGYTSEIQLIETVSGRKYQLYVSY